MTATTTTSSAAPMAKPQVVIETRTIPTAALWSALIAVIAVLAIIHLGQGSSGLGWHGVLQVLTGRGTEQAEAIFYSARLPRAAAGCLVGIALGISGAILQAIARNPLASPDTLGINAGAHLVLTLAATLGIPIGIFTGTAAAFVGGLLAASVALLISSGGTSPIRLILAGSVLALALSAITSMIMILDTEGTMGMFAWGAGTLGQSGSGPTARALPLILLTVVIALVLAPRLDLLQLGDDAAQSLGLRVGTTRVVLVALAVLLSAAAVSVAGPLGFVGLCAPALTRMLRRWVPRLRFHRPLLIGAALMGVVLVLGADVALRLIFDSTDAVEVPTGVITTAIGALFMIILSRGMKSGRSDASPALVRAWALGRQHPGWVIIIGIAFTIAIGWASLLLGDVKLLGGDVLNWLTQTSSIRISIIMDSRWPRVLAAAVAGGCLALAGGLTQTATRNALADTGLLGVTAGAGAGAIVSLTLWPAAGWSILLTGALIGGVAAAALVFGLSASSGLDGIRLILVGLGVSAGAASLTTLFIVRSDPYNQAKAITWLGGSTYGTDPARVGAAAVILVLSGIVVAAMRRELDVIQLDGVTPRVLGVSVTKSRLIMLTLAVMCTVAATAAVGVISFVGLVAPHCARLLVGSRHRYFLPTAIIVGAAMVTVADTVGRTVIAPGQIPAGMMTALIGTPYFIWLLWKLRGDRA